MQEVTLPLYLRLGAFCHFYDINNAYTSTHTLSGVQIKAWNCSLHRIFNISLWGRLYKTKLKPELSFIISIAILEKNVSNRVKTTRNILYVLKTVQLNHFIVTICTLNLMFLFLYVQNSTACVTTYMFKFHTFIMKFLHV